MNKFKKYQLFIPILLIFLFTSSCSEKYYYSGISEQDYNKLVSDSSSTQITKSSVIEIIGLPLIKESNDNIWIYNISKAAGNQTFKKVIYKKTIKLYFEKNILKNIKEISL